MLDPSQFPQNFQVPSIIPSQSGGLYGANKFVDPRYFPGLAGQGVPNAAFIPPPGTNAVSPSPATPPEIPPTPPDNNNPPTQPDSGTDFLADVRKVGGDILGGVLGVLDLPAKVIARPVFEYATEPWVFQQKIAEGGFDIWKDINLLNEAFDANQAPGIVKFAGEMAFDPLTYLSAGTLSAVSKAKYIAPILERIPGGVEGAAAAVSGLKKYENAVDSAFSSGGDLVRGLATNYIPLTTAKQNARGILTKILPDSLVDGILNNVPSEYTGIPIGAIADPLNKAVPKLGLPRVLAAPDVRLLKQQSAFNTTFDAVHNAFSNRGINIFQPDSATDYGKVLRNIAYNPQIRTYTDLAGNIKTDASDFVASSVLRQPSLLTTTDIGRINSQVGGLLKRDIVTPGHQLQFNSLVQQYHMGQLDQGTTIQALQQLFGTSAKSNPESGQIFKDFLDRRDLATTTTIADLSKMEPQQMVASLASMAKQNANKAFDLKIDSERAANTYMDQFLNKFDNVYTNVYKNAAMRFIIQPVSMLYLGFIGYPIGNAIESYARHVVGGGGLDLPVNTANFNVENGLLNVPRELTAEQSRQAYIAKEITARASGTPLDYPTNWVRDAFIQPGSKLEQSMRRHYWNNALQQELDNVWFAKGLGARVDFQGWINASKPIDVNADPTFAGLSQSIADSVSRMSVKAVQGGITAVNGVKNAIDTGLFNREKLTADLLDNTNAANLHPSSRAIVSNWARNGEASSAAASQMVDDVIANEKKLVEIAPQVLSEKFQGLSAKIISRANSPTFNVGDLYQNVNDLRSLYEQYAGIPEMLRMREYETLQINQLKGMDTAAVHDEFARRLKDSMDTINKVIQPAYTQLIGQSDRLGLRAETESYINALRAQQDALAETWNIDSEFRQNFFAGKPDRHLQSTWDDPVTGYFPQRQRIWQGFMQKQSQLSMDATSARLQLEQGIKAAQMRQAAFQSKMADIAAQANPFIPTDRDLRIAHSSLARANAGNPSAIPDFNSPEVRNLAVQFTKARARREAAPTITEMGLQPTMATGQTVWVPLNGGWQEARIMGDLNTGKVFDPGIAEGRSVPIKWTLSDSPTIQVSTADIRLKPDEPSFGEKWDAEHIEQGIKSGQPIENIAAGINDNPTPDNGIPAEQSTSETSDGAGVIKDVRPGQDGANDITGNGPSADSARNVPTSDFILNEYKRADSIRSWLEPALANAFQNPAITDTQKKALISYVDGIHTAYNSLDQTNRKILNDSMREAVDRTRERYFNAYINYDDQTVFDFMAKHIFPFWVYESRRWPYLANIAAKFPGLAAAYNNYMDKTDQGYISIGEIPFDINPLRGTVLGGINRAVGRDYPPRHTEGLQGALDSIEQTFGRFGFYMGPHISIPSQIIRGEAGQTLPELFSTAINAGRAANLPGAAGLQDLLPDPFRDYYVRQILATQGFEPDKIYEAAAADPNSTEAMALDTAQRQASLVGIILGQTGVLRYRTPAYEQYTEQRQQAIEAITGISVQQQKEMQANGVSITQVSTLTPAQRQQLAALPGTNAFQEISEPLLNPTAQKMRQAQRDFFDAVKTERANVTADQTTDDNRLAQGIISGVEWRKRYQDRSGRVSDLINDLKKSEAYKNVPISSDEQAAARQRFNLPPITQSPVDIVLNEYYNIKPEVDAVTGDVNWSDFFAQRQAVLQKYPAVYQAVKDQIEKNDTPQVRQFRADMEMLRPYFGIKDQILAQYPQLAQEVSYLQYLQNTNPVEAATYRQNSTEIKMLNKMVQQYQDQARQQFPQLDAALVKWYGATPMQVQMLNKSGGGGVSSGTIGRLIASGKHY